MENNTKETLLDKFASLIAKISNKIINTIANIRDFILALLDKMEYAAVI